jgi:hypothetical protein
MKYLQGKSLNSQSGLDDNEEQKDFIDDGYDDQELMDQELEGSRNAMKQSQFDGQYKNNSSSLKVIFENVDENQYRMRKDSLFQNPLSGPNNLKIEGEDLNNDLIMGK